MPELLLELLSEEIPARMQAQAARDLERLTREALASAGLLPEALTAFAGPRRLTLVAEGLAPAQPDRAEERKGPRVSAPDQAIEGFLRSTGLSRDQLVERDGVYFAHIHRRGRTTAEIIAEAVPQIVRSFPWPKSMTWGSGDLRWVRPLKRILCVFDGEVVPFEVGGVVSDNVSEGHRVMGARQPFKARNFDEYAKGLKAGCVVLDPEERKARILEGARTLCFARGLELVEDVGLLDEVAGLVEWPVPILGAMDPAFLDLPPEVIRTSMRTHQRYFAVRDPETGRLAPHFLVTANIEAIDGGAAIAAGNAKVLSARLSDAKFFWDEDRRVSLEFRLEKLKGVTFHAQLGTMYERVERIAELAREIASRVKADAESAAKAARLAKADLGSGMVGEFPELQGVMGGYYARSEGLGDEIADAIRDQYKPQGPSDSVPTASLAAAVALADKLDTLVGFFAVNEKPTGSRDPYALRRAALGVIRILLHTKARVSLRMVTGNHCINYAYQDLMRHRFEQNKNISDAKKLFPDANLGVINLDISESKFYKNAGLVSTELLAFFADRLKVMLRDDGKRHDLVDAIFALGDDDLVRIVARVEALTAFLATDDGANLLAGYKRASNILRAEEKKGPLPTGPSKRLEDAPDEEIELREALDLLTSDVDAALAAEDFAAAMRALARLRAPVDAFFDKVLVNADDPAARDNRLRLLAEVRGAMGRVADFSQISG